MQRAIIALSLCLAAGAAHAAVEGCPAAAAPLTSDPLAALPSSPELAAPSRPAPGTPRGVLGQALDESLSVDNVLLRLRLQEQCLAVARAAPATGPSLPGSAAPGGYKPQTQFDNTPWRFDMSQNGKRMTAEEFDAWMKARGVRVAKGAPGTAPAAPPVTPPPDDAKGEPDQRK